MLSLFAILVASQLSACAPKRPSASRPHHDTPPAAGEHTAWWQREHPCPDGTHLAGERRHELWCERADGTRHGPWVRWYRGGDPVGTIGRYRDGHKYGIEVTDWETGALWIRRHFRGGRLHGREVRWSKDGTRAFEGRWCEGEKHGAWTYVRADGSIRRTEIWRHGERVEVR